MIRGFTIEASSGATLNSPGGTQLNIRSLELLGGGLGIGDPLQFNLMPPGVGGSHTFVVAPSFGGEAIFVVQGFDYHTAR